MTKKDPMGIVEALEAKALKNRSWAVRIADELTGFFGGMAFLLINLVVFIFWILANTGHIPGVNVFDPFPFVLLTTTVSLEAIILTTIVLMSQNRSSLISSLREEMDMQVNLIAEREITKALKLLRILLKEKGIVVRDAELTEMLKEIDTSYMERELTYQLNHKKKSLIESLSEPIEEVVEDVERPIARTVKRIERAVEKTT
ncbi:DUF1003 domain-containing protein [Candidatus Woesebacteria bacterium]|nr:DUF1003 domain-containing protein [Candidatus Woesebacteria bacterium]